MRILNLLAYTATVLAQQANCLGRIQSLFEEHPDFNDDLLIKLFREKPEEEFLLSETQDLQQEFLTEFPDILELS